MKRILPILLFLACVGIVPARAQVQCANDATTSITSSCNVSVPSSPTISTVAMIFQTDSSNIGTPTICGQPGVFKYTSSWGGAASALYVLQDAPSGTCTVTGTTGSSAAPHIKTSAWVISGLNYYTIESILTPNGNVSGSGTILGKTISPNDIVAVFANSQTSGSNSFNTPSGYTLLGSQSNGVDFGSAAFTQTISSGGTVVNPTVSWTSGDGGSVYGIIFRTVLPSLDMVQQQFCTSGDNVSVASLACTFDLPPLALNDHIVIYGGKFDPSFTITTSNGLTSPTNCQYYPGNFYGASPTSFAYDCFDSISSSGAPITVTMTTTSSNSPMDMFITQVHGTAQKTQVLAGNSSNTVIHTSHAGTTQDPGPIFIPQNGSYYVPNFVSTQALGQFPATNFVTPGTGFVVRQIFQFSTYLSAFMDARVTVTGASTSAPQSIDNAATSTISFNPWTQMLAMAAANYLNPVVVTDYKVSGIGGSLTMPISEGSTGCRGEALMVLNTTGASFTTPTDTAGDIWVNDTNGGCTTSSNYCIAHTNSLAAGALTVTFGVGSGSSFNVGTVKKICDVGPYVTTQAVTGTSTAASVSTSTTTADYVIGEGLNWGNGSGGNVFGTIGGSQDWTSTLWGFADGASFTSFKSIPTSNGTSSQSITCDSGGVGCAGILQVWGPAPVPAVSTKFEQIITKNDLKHWEGEFVR